MYTHDKRLQFEAKPERPDPVLARRMQELIGGQYGEITVMMQYQFQGWNCRHPGKYKDLIMDTGVEEIGHVEMLATMVARLVEGAPLETQEAAMASDPSVAACAGSPGRLGVGAYRISATASDVSFLVARLGMETGRVVVDRTGLTGTYEMDLRWSPDRPLSDGVLPAVRGGPSLYTAIEEQLGLRLVPRDMQVDMLVVERASLPTPD
jgi:hypothetical protein